MNNKYGNRIQYDAAIKTIADGLWKVDPVAGVILSAARHWKPIGSLRDGYLRVAVPMEDGRFYSISSHRVIWEDTHGPSDLDLTLNHINGDHTDNRIENLELITNQANILHGHRVLGRANGSRNKGAINPRAKLTEDLVKEIKERQARGIRGVEIAKEFGIAQSTVCQIKQGRTWGWV